MATVDDIQKIMTAAKPERYALILFCFAGLSAALYCTFKMYSLSQGCSDPVERQEMIFSSGGVLGASGIFAVLTYRLLQMTTAFVNKMDSK